MKSYHGHMQADMVMEKELRVLQNDKQVAQTTVCQKLNIDLAKESSKSTSTVTHIFNLGHTYSYNATPPNNDTP